MSKRNRQRNRPKTEERAALLAPVGGPPYAFRPAYRIIGPNHTSTDVNEQTALCLTAAFACVRAVSTDVAVLPLQLTQKLNDGSYRQAIEHRAYDLFADSPDGGNTTAMRSIQAVMCQLLTAGQAFYGIDTYNDGSLALRLLDPRLVQVLYTPSKEVVYQVAGISELLDRSRIVHFAGLGWDGLTAYAPTSLAKQALSLAQTQENYSASFSANGNTASGLLKSTQAYTPEAAAQLVDDFMDMTMGGNLGGVGFLPVGVDFQKLTIDPQNAQQIESREFMIREVARVFGCPLNRIGELVNYSYAGMEAENAAYLATTLRHWTTTIQSSLDLRLLTREERRKGFGFRFDLSDLQRADSAARAALYSSLWNVGAITQNEIRTREGLPRVDDDSADRLHTPLNFQASGGTTDDSKD